MFTKHKIPASIWASAVFLLLFVALFSYLDKAQTYYYYHLEQRQIFLYDTDFFLKTIRQVGGWGFYLTQYLVQFFRLPHIGALTSAILGTLLSISLFMGLRPLSKSPLMILGCLALPFLGVLWMFDFYFYYLGYFSFCLCGPLFWGYTAMGRRCSWPVRLAADVLASLLIYYLLGPIALVWSVMAAIFDFAARLKRPYAGLAGIVTICLFGMILVSQAILPSFGQAMGVMLYIDHLQTYSIAHSMAWYAMTSVVLTAALLGIRPNLGKDLAVTAVALTTLFLMGRTIDSMIHDRDLYNLHRLLCHMRAEEWQDIIQDTSYQNSLLYENMRNLALQRQGRLLTDLFRYPQHNGAAALFVDHQHVVELNEIFSHIYFHTGHVSASQCFALEVFSGLRWGSPSILQIAIRTEIALGCYSVAEKYIRILERTRYYSDWACGMRRFLGDEQAILQDETLGRLRRNLSTEEGGFLLQSLPYFDFLKILDANPSDLAARDYAFASLLLDRNEEGIAGFMERYEGKAALEQIPPLMQQAIITLHELDMDYCRAHGVSPEVISRYQSFKNRLMQMRHSQGATQSSLARDFKDTYWYYLLFR